MGCTCGKGQKDPKVSPLHTGSSSLPPDRMGDQVQEGAYRIAGGIDWDGLEREAKGENLRFVRFY